MCTCTLYTAITRIHLSMKANNSQITITTATQSNKNYRVDCITLRYKRKNARENNRRSQELYTVTYMHTRKNADSNNRIVNGNGRIVIIRMCIYCSQPSTTINNFYVFFSRFWYKVSEMRFNWCVWSSSTLSSSVLLLFG